MRSIRNRSGFRCACPRCAHPRPVCRSQGIEAHHGKQIPAGSSAVVFVLFHQFLIQSLEMQKQRSVDLGIILPFSSLARKDLIILYNCQQCWEHNTPVRNCREYSTILTRGMFRIRVCFLWELLGDLAVAELEVAKAALMKEKNACKQRALADHIDDFCKPVHCCLRKVLRR